jgi:membrane protease subunit (stomatin/prohibitin family)
MSIIDVVSWQSPEYHDKIYAWRFPENELSTWTQLLVGESQEAVLYRSGAVDGPFGPGRHVLKTENIPILGKILNLPFGRSPFTAEVWYVNKAIPLDVKWGTREPIRIMDPEHKIMVPVVARGQYGMQIENSRKFLIKLVGAMPDFTREKMQDYFRGLILTVAKTTIAKEIVKKKVSVLEIAAELSDLSVAVQAAMQETLEEFGIKLVNFYISGIDVQEGDQSIETLREALSTRARMNIVGYNYQQERSFNAMEGAAGYTAADNGLQAAGGGLAAAALGLGVGIGMGGPMGQVMGSQMTQNVSPNLSALPPAPEAGSKCPKCSAPLSPNAKFCGACGASTGPEMVPCASCGVPIVKGAAFCMHCGKPTVASCTKCGAKLTPGSKFCGECGTPSGTAGGQS